MTNRILLLFYVLLGACTPPSAQDRFAGNWYSFSRNRLLRFTIGADSIVNQLLTFDLVPLTQREVYRQAMAIESRRTEGDCLLLQLAEKRADSMRRFPGRFCFREGGLEFGNDSTTPGIAFINEAELQRMRRLPPVDSMDAAGLGRYVKAVMSEKARLDRLSKGGSSAHDVLYFAYHRLRLAMAEAGYSPLYRDAPFEAMLRRFQSDPESAGLVRQLLQED
ncbi:hypothetical protein [Flaviaesturariibacter aridisoli]|uniref:Lipoprotein n=1 Tax=Flaviaesturariibacter aridisoli TaxID=2545761 RepID=A0A4R4E2R4_9BACT|nr:hypothetical protein [Flaviaesturariibacter aridisoli]TCZ71024.1 hypothetical protein E0486_10395 [Flaviaesturariibacter aridisoli]